MLTLQNPSRLRLINLLIPPSNDPLLTPYKKQINPKIQPMKRNFSILSNLRQRKTIKQPKLQLSKNDFDKINRSYRSLKRLNKNYHEQTQNHQEKDIDPQYMNLIQLRKSMIKKKRILQKGNILHSRTTSHLNDKQFYFFGITQPGTNIKSDPNKNNLTSNQQKSRYHSHRCSYQYLSKKDNFLQQNERNIAKKR